MAPLEVHIAAEQFAWNIHYPGPDRTIRAGARRADRQRLNPSASIAPTRPRRTTSVVVNTLTCPIGRPVIITLTARDVIHSFTINEMRVRQDATPGLTVRTWFTPMTAGKFEIRCSQLCGLGHYRMRGDVSVVTPDAWDRWQRSELALIQPKPRS